MMVKMLWNVYSTGYSAQPQRAVIIIFTVMMRWSWLIPADKSQPLPLLPSSAFSDIMTNLKLAFVLLYVKYRHSFPAQQSIYTMEMGKCYESGFFFAAPKPDVEHFPVCLWQ